MFHLRAAAGLGSRNIVTGSKYLNGISNTFAAAAGVAAGTEEVRHGVSALQGRRKNMEDYHLVVHMPSRPDHLLACVWDGHCGVASAKFVQENFLTVLEQTEEWAEYVKSEGKHADMIGNAMIAASKHVDGMLKDHLKEINEYLCGSAALTVIVTPEFIVCSNAGDCRCVLGHIDGSVTPLSFDHKPNNEGEKARIEAAGHAVKFVGGIARLAGNLALSRGFGDFEYKNREDLPAEEQAFSCVPEITVRSRQPSTDEALVMGCDGVWDVMSNEAAVEEVHRVYAKQKRIHGEGVRMSQVAGGLVNTAYRLGKRTILKVFVDL
jgi:serine/threonine protein phosphatase PrpC